MTATPAKRCRTSSTPDKAASAAMTSDMPPSSATLSAVPNTEMTHSLTPGGTASITAPPTAVTGETVGLTRPAASSPSTTAVPTATSPAPAAHRSRRRWASGVRPLLRLPGLRLLGRSLAVPAAPAFPPCWPWPARVPSISSPCPSRAMSRFTVCLLSGSAPAPGQAEPFPAKRRPANRRLSACRLGTADCGAGVPGGDAGSGPLPENLAVKPLGGKQQREAAAAVDVFHADGALVGTDDSGDDAQAKPGPAVAQGTRAAPPAADPARECRHHHPVRDHPHRTGGPEPTACRPAAGRDPSASRSRRHAAGLLRGSRRSRP